MQILKSLFTTRSKKNVAFLIDKIHYIREKNQNH